MREIKKPSSSRTANSNCSLQKTVTNLLQKSVLQLCKDSVQFGSQLQIMGVLCMTIDDECSDIVVKVNETFRKDENELDQPTANRGTPPPQTEQFPNTSASTGAGKYTYGCENGVVNSFRESEQLISTSRPKQREHAVTLGNANSASRSDTVSDCGISTCSSSGDGPLGGVLSSATHKHSHKRKRSPKKFLLQNWVEKQQRAAATQKASTSSNTQSQTQAKGTGAQAQPDFDALANAIQRRAQPLDSTTSTIPESVASSSTSTASTSTSTGDATVHQNMMLTPKRGGDSAITPVNTPKKGEQQQQTNADISGHMSHESSGAMNGFVAPPTIVGIVPLRTVATSQFVPGGMQHHAGPLVATFNGYAQAQAQAQAAAMQNAAAHQQLAAFQSAQISAQINAIQNANAQRAAAYLDLPPGCGVPYFVPVRNAPPAHSHSNLHDQFANNQQMANDMRLATISEVSASSEHTNRPAILVRHVGESPSKHHGLLKQFDSSVHRGGAASLPNSPLKTARRERDGQPSILALAEAAEFVQRQSADCDHPNDPMAAAGASYMSNPMAVAVSPAVTPKWASPARGVQLEAVEMAETVVNPAAAVEFEHSDDGESQRNVARPKSASRKRVGGPRHRPASGTGSGTDSVSGSATASATRRKRVSSAFKCNQCAASFSTLGELTQHTVADHGAYKCTVCSLHFTQRSNLQRHSLRHVGFKPYQCALCSVEYYRKDHLIRHVSTVHSGTDVRSAVIERLSSSECLSFLERLRNDSRSESANPCADDDKLDTITNEEEVKFEEEVVFGDADGDGDEQTGGDEKRADALLRIVSPNGNHFEDVSEEEQEQEHDETLKVLPAESDIHCESVSTPKKGRPESALSAQEECTVNVRECLANGGQTESTK